MNSDAIIHAHDLRKIYRVGSVEVPALRGVDISVQPGEFLSIVGPSGSGKSTLFHIIGGLTPPTSGEIHVAGENLADLTDAGRTQMRRRTVGFVFQKFNLLPNLTARDNIAVARFIAGSDSKPDPRFEEVLRLLGIAGRLDHKPNALSGGEQQRIAIARAIVNHPAILLADEPTGNLDAGSGQGVLELLRDLNRERGLTMIVVTHDPNIAQQADRVVRLAEGRVEEWSPALA
jgi:putative ABC transport system ATP-binding protein